MRRVHVISASTTSWYSIRLECSIASLGEASTSGAQNSSSQAFCAPKCLILWCLQAAHLGVATQADGLLQELDGLQVLLPQVVRLGEHEEPLRSLHIEPRIASYRQRTLTCGKCGRLRTYRTACRCNITDCRPTLSARCQQIQADVVFNSKCARAAEV